MKVLIPVEFNDITQVRLTLSSQIDVSVTLLKTYLVDLRHSCIIESYQVVKKSLLEQLKLNGDVVKKNNPAISHVDIELLIGSFKNVISTFLSKNQFDYILIKNELLPVSDFLASPNKVIA